jgi:hypothetical protein
MRAYFDHAFLSAKPLRILCIGYRGHPKMIDTYKNHLRAKSFCIFLRTS